MKILCTSTRKSSLEQRQMSEKYDDFSKYNTKENVPEALISNVYSYLSGVEGFIQFCRSECIDFSYDFHSTRFISFLKAFDDTSARKFDECEGESSTEI